MGEKEAIYYKKAAVEQGWSAHISTVANYLHSNPGSTVEEVAEGTDLTVEQVRYAAEQSPDILNAASRVYMERPLVKATLYDETYAVADEDILSTYLTPLHATSLYDSWFRVELTPEEAGVLSLVTKHGDNTLVSNFNANVDLDASAAYRFGFFVSNGETINFRYSVATTFKFFMVGLHLALKK